MKQISAAIIIGMVFSTMFLVPAIVFADDKNTYTTESYNVNTDKGYARVTEFTPKGNVNYTCVVVRSGIDDFNVNGDAAVMSCIPKGQ